MGLDIYSGTLTRYYAGNWETLVQRWARENNIEFETTRANQPEDAIHDPNEIIQIIEDWRINLSNQLKDYLSESFYWQEDNESDYYTDKPGWDCHGALILWASYAESPGIEPPHEYNDEWTEDEAYRASNSEDFNSKYDQIIGVSELWFPVNFSFTFKGPDASGNQVWMGSSFELMKQLNELNQVTWNADRATINDWRREIDPNSKLLEEKAKFGFSILYRIAEFSVKNRKPIKMDY